MPRPSSRPLLKAYRACPVVLSYGRQAFSSLDRIIPVQALKILILMVVAFCPLLKIMQGHALMLSCSSYNPKNPDSGRGFAFHPDSNRIRMSIQSLNLCHANNVARGFLQALVGVLQDADVFGEGVNANR